MKNKILSESEKLILRECVQKKLTEVKFKPDKRIKLPKEMLENILFDKTENEKYFGYFGDGLCKLDLSEISFDNVSFSSQGAIDLSNTNIKIDFRTVLLSSYQQHDRIILDNVDFTNVDLSDSHLGEKDICDFSHCSFKNTNLSFNSARIYEFDKCDLTGVDLSSTTLYSMAWRYNRRDGNMQDSLVSKNKEHLLIIRNCNLSNTGAIIKVGPDNPKDPYVINEFSEEKSRRQIGRLMAKGYLKNCIIEDETIKPIYSKKELLEMEKNKTSVKSNEMIEDTLSKIDEQVKFLKLEKLF